MPSCIATLMLYVQEHDVGSKVVDQPPPTGEKGKSIWPTVAGMALPVTCTHTHFTPSL